MKKERESQNVAVVHQSTHTAQHAHTHSRTLSENPSRLVVAAPPNTAGVKQQITPQDPFSVFLAEKQLPETQANPLRKRNPRLVYCIVCIFVCICFCFRYCEKAVRWLYAAPHISRSCACEEGERAPLGVKTRKRRLRRASFCAREENAAVMQGRWRAPTHVFLRADASNKPLPGPAARR